MQYFVIKESDIPTCNKSGVVACWSDEHDAPLVAVTPQTRELFGDRDEVTCPIS